MRVALEPERPADMQKLVNGLNLLSQSDPCVETFQQQTGEHVILTAGELHLEVEFSVLVFFNHLSAFVAVLERLARTFCEGRNPGFETNRPFPRNCCKGPRYVFLSLFLFSQFPDRCPVDMALTKTPNARRGTIQSTSSQQVVSFTVRAAPVPTSILEFILDNLATWKSLQHDREIQQGHSVDEEEVDNYGELIRKPTVSPEQFWDVFAQKCREVGGEWADVADKTWGFGPQKAGGCLLIDARSPKPYAS